MKSPAKTNHIIGGSGNGIKELFSYYLRRFYLVHYTFIQTLKSNTFWNAILIYPFLLIDWFIKASIKITWKSVRFKFSSKNKQLT